MNKNLNQLRAKTVNFKQLTLLKSRKKRERRLAPINYSPSIQTLSDSQKQQIRRLKMEGLTANQIAKELEIATSLVLLVEVKL
jgi:DNA-binding NarL/FixJ family response regulator